MIFVTSLVRGGSARVLGALTVGAVLGFGPFACSSSAALSGAGGACTVVTDCQDGLICCNGSPGNKASLTCATSVSCLQPAGAGADSGGMMATGTGDDAAPAPQGDGQAPSTDATEPPEGGGPMEAEAREAAPPPVDAGKGDDAAVREAAAPPVDAGTGGTDAAGD
ncbi:MAG TPA: hypothetical protein VII82_11040 [Polyangiaceae bacterium]